MSSRQRRPDESYKDYKHNLRIESMAERMYTGGKWLWKSHYIDKSGHRHKINGTAMKVKVED